ncbi:hypothetical protein FACS189444_3170 [Spirochaetia bacterium]|nr:hypothetical protein FACS189444_3170 [Spirochaetia bacterium]
MAVQNKKAPTDVDVRGIVDFEVVTTVDDIFTAVMNLSPMQDLFTDLTKRLVDDLYGQSFMEFNLELSDDQKKALGTAIASRGHETARIYLANLKEDERAEKIYEIVKLKTAAIADKVLRSIGAEVNRGAIINASAVQCNSKAPNHNEITLWAGKAGGDITIPTQCVLIATNCVEVIKKSCAGKFEDKLPEPGGEEEE